MIRKKKKLGDENKSQLQAVTFSDSKEQISSLKKSQLNSYDELESYKRLRKRRIKIAFCRMAIWLFVVCFIPVFVFLSIIIVSPSKGHNFFGYTFFIVVSNSMVPEIDVNDCIVVKKVKYEASIKVGDDITFIRQSDGQTVTHKVMSVFEKDGRSQYITKGVHNPVADEGAVSFENIIGKRIATIGWVGQLIMFFRTWYGMVTFVGIFLLVMGLFVLSFRISEDIRAVGK